MMLDEITPVVITFNEAPNLARTLRALSWATRVVVLDSGSTDATQKIAAQFPNVRFVVRPFDDHTTQWNHGVDACGTNWILSLDCDYVLCPGFEDELSKLDENTACDAFYAAVEKRDNPELKDKPVLVGGTTRGVVTTACYIARKFGPRSAMPMFKALAMCPQAVVIRPDMAKYKRVSQDIRRIFDAATPVDVLAAVSNNIYTIGNVTAPLISQTCA